MHIIMPILSFLLLLVEPSGIDQVFIQGHPSTDRQELPLGKASCRPTVRKYQPFLTS
jgi:hypothetical protein